LLFHVDLTVAQTSAHISVRVTKFKKITRFFFVQNMSTMSDNHNVT
jgi:hypothetical protein